MSRLQKKCFMASVAMHTTLVLVLFFGAAFLAPKELKEPMRTITMIPRNIVDSTLSGGGGAPPPPAAVVAPPAPVETPRVEPTPPEPVRPVEPPPQPRPTPPAPAPEPVRVAPPTVESKRPPRPIDRTVTKKAKETKTQPVEPVSTAKTASKAPETKSAPKVDLSKAKMVARNTSEVEARAEKERQAQAAQAAAAAAAAKRRADQINGITGALSNLKDNLSSGISIEPVGGDGAAFANYGQAVVSAYENAWVVPNDITDENVIVQVTVTIARDGTVVRASIARNSSNATVNKSVKRTLDGVKFVAPFPAGAKDAERTFNIDFNLKAKRLRG
jgi:TonB family protein